MQEGYSFESFAGTVDVCFDTLYEWAKVHPEFSEAKKNGLGKNLHTMETLGLTDGMKDAKWIFTMKNRFPSLYKERHEVSQETIHKHESVNELAEKLSELLKL